MMHKAWSSIEEVSYCFSRSSIKFQGNVGPNVADFDPKMDVSGLWLEFELLGRSQQSNPSDLPCWMKPEQNDLDFADWIFKRILKKGVVFWIESSW